MTITRALCVEVQALKISQTVLSYLITEERPPVMVLFTLPRSSSSKNRMPSSLAAGSCRGLRQSRGSMSLRGKTTKTGTMNRGLGATRPTTSRAPITRSLAYREPRHLMISQRSMGELLGQGSEVKVPVISNISSKLLGLTCANLHEEFHRIKWTGGKFSQFNRMTLGRSSIPHKLRYHGDPLVHLGGIRIDRLIKIKRPLTGI